MSRAQLEVSGLTVGYRLPSGRINVVVADVSLTLVEGEITALAGESGCGKSTTALAAIGYRGSGTEVLGGRALLGDVDLLELPMAKLRAIWGRRIAYLPQNAAASLNPALTVGGQLAEPLRVHLGLGGDDLRQRQIELLSSVALPDPERALQRYPHQFSGGQQQRIMIAIAISCSPDVLILDEPTTGLDVTTQAKISSLLRRLVTETGLAALYVSHDLALLAGIADHLAVMYGGEIAELGSVDSVSRHPLHPYTRALYDAVPSAHSPRVVKGIPGSPPTTVHTKSCAFAARCPYVVDRCLSEHPELRLIRDGHRARCLRIDELGAKATTGDPLAVVDHVSPAATPLLEVLDLHCTYRSRKRTIEAVQGVSLDLAEGETLGIVGESGSGKSTLLRAVVGLHRPSSGSIRFQGQELAPRAVLRARNVRREIQLVFQNPDLSLNPRHTIDSILRRPVRVLRDDVPRSGEKAVIDDLLAAVKLPPSALGRYPFELSGGQKQRVALARAFAARPSILLCDEVTSSLDVSVQATILDLIADLSQRFRTAVLFVSHDLAVVRTIAHRAIVMQDGVIREEGVTNELFANPTDAYTRELISAIPDPRRVSEGPVLPLTRT